MNEIPRLAIGIPHVGDLPDYFFKSVVALKKGPTGSYFLTMVKNHPVDLARNLIVETMLDGSDATHLLFLDADMTFPILAAERLLAADKDIVSGVYFARAETPSPHVYEFNRRDEGGVYWYRSLAEEFAEWCKRNPGHVDQGNEAIFPSHLVKVDAVGAGCLLIKRHVLERMYELYGEEAYPWFKCHDGSRGGEDFTFCRRAQAAGFAIWADFGVQCNHYAPGNFTGREEFVTAFGIGTKHEFDFSEPIEFSIGPDGRRKAKLPGNVIVDDGDADRRPTLLERLGVRR